MELSKTTSEGEIEQKTCTICGIYSDITNGGKTAKGCINDETPTVWSIMYVSLKDSISPDTWISDYSKGSAENIKIAEISEYINGMYGQTIRSIGKASVMTKVIACVVIMVVILLLMRLIIWRERRESSLKKALGLTTSNVRTDYLKKLSIYLLIGLVFGILSGLLLGPRMAGILFSFMGAKGLGFTMDPISTFAIIPILMIVSVFTTAAISLKEVKNIRAYECLNTRE